MVKKNMGSVLALYPMPVTIVGAMVEGKPNWLQVAHVGIIGHDRVTISCAKNHYTNQGIRATGVCSVSLVNEELLKKADYIGSVSGAKADKSDVFAWSAAENGAPMPDEAPLTLECRVVDVYESEGFETFVLAIDGTHVEEDCLNEKSKIDYEKVRPVLFEFPTYSYFRTGDRIAGCLRLDEE